MYVLEPHPTHPDILLSGAHDGSIIIWEISTKQILYKYNNNIEGENQNWVKNIRNLFDERF